MHEMLIAEPADLEMLAHSVLADIATRERDSHGATVLALHGELGAGKTSFVQYLARVLGVEEYVPSPTFVVMRRYPLSVHERFSALVHMDAYRIGSLDELRPLDFTEILADPGNLLCIEWAERIQEALPAYTYHVTFTTDPAGGDVRRVVYGDSEEA